MKDKRRLVKGWVLQDLEWIEPKDAEQVDAGYWYVDGEWLELERANRRHSKIDRMWVIPRAEVLLHTTLDREVALRAIGVMERAIEEMRKVFGAEPELPLRVGLVRDEEQYDRFAFGDPDGRRLPSHAGRWNLIHSAFFAESFFVPEKRKHEYRGMGIGYWDSLAPNGDLFGVNAARLAVGLSYVEALDPSPKAVRSAAKDGPGSDYYSAFRAEKKLPEWLRYGAAVYAERYYEDTTVPSDGDPWWARNWSTDSLRGRGGMRPLDEIFTFEIDPADRADGQKFLIEAGLVVAFIVDGGCAPVSVEHAKLKKALLAGRVTGGHIEALSEALRANVDSLLSFGGL